MSRPSEPKKQHRPPPSERKGRDRKTPRPRSAETKRLESRPAPGRGGEARDKHRILRPEAANLAGLTLLMNQQHLKPDVSLEDAERRIMGRPAAAPAAPAATADDELGAFAKDLYRIASELGLDLLDDAVGAEAPLEEPPQEPAAAQGGEDKSGPPGRRAERKNGRPDEWKAGQGPAPAASGWPGKPAGKARAPPAERPGTGAPGRRALSPPAPGSSGPLAQVPAGSSGTEPILAQARISAEEEEEADEDEDDEEDDEEDEEDGDGGGAVPAAAPAPGDPPRAETDDAVVADIIARVDSELDLVLDPRAERKRVSVRPIFSAPAPDGGRPPAAGQPTEAQLRVRNALAGLRNEARAAPALHESQVFDDKVAKLEKISRLLQALDEEGVDCSAVPPLSRESTIDEIDAILQTLTLKNDSNRCTSLAEELLVGAAELLSDTFDGTREIPFFGWKPNYTGYHAVVAAKVSRMRLETSMIVSTAFNNLKIGPLTRVIVELVPSMLLFPRQQARQKGPGLGGSLGLSEQQAALAEIRGADARRQLREI